MRVIDVIQQDELFSSPYPENSHKHRASIIYAFVGPILFSLLVGLKSEVVKDYGEINDILLRQLARNQKDGFGDFGKCFEYAVHSAIRNDNALVMERIKYALSLCGVKGSKTTSILLGFEKAGVLQINNELINILTPDSKLITGLNGESIKIQEHIENMINSFHYRQTRNRLPAIISGIWKADMFIGNIDTDMWVAASVKSNRFSLKFERGLCIGIVPARWNQEPACYTENGMVVCPLLYSKGFMEFFNSAWRVVTTFLKNDAHVPNERFLSNIEELMVAKRLESMRENTVLSIVDEDLRYLAHPTLLRVEDKKIITLDAIDMSQEHISNSVIIVPDSLLVISN